jgi:hypothetical protein
MGQRSVTSQGRRGTAVGHNHTTPLPLPTPSHHHPYSVLATMAFSRPRAPLPSPLRTASPSQKGAHQTPFTSTTSSRYAHSGADTPTSPRHQWARNTMDVEAAQQRFGSPARTSFGSTASSTPTRSFYASASPLGWRQAESHKSPPGGAVGPVGGSWRERADARAAAAAAASRSSFFASPTAHGNGSFFSRSRWGESPAEARERQHPEWAPTTWFQFQHQHQHQHHHPTPAAHGFGVGHVDAPREIAPGRSGLPEEPAWLGCVGGGVRQIQEFLLKCKILSVAAAKADGVGNLGEQTAHAIAKVCSLPRCSLIPPPLCR